MDSLSAAKEKTKALAGASSEAGFMTVTLSTSPLDDWRQFAPTFLNSEFNRVTKERELTKSRSGACRPTSIKCSGFSTTTYRLRLRVSPSSRTAQSLNGSSCHLGS